MQIKVIKKGENTNQEKETNFFQPEVRSERQKERKVERNILDWISDLRQKKNLEFANTQVLLENFR